MRYKHPRTYHFSFSASVQNDDKIISSVSTLEGREVVVTLKYDGENTSLYPDYMHAKSIDSPTNWTRDVAKKIHSVLRYQIPEGWRLGCENMYAKHAIFYPEGYLEGYLYLLFVWNEKNECLSWDEMQEFASELDLPTPKVLYRGVYDEKVLRRLAKNLDTTLEEGFVVRDAGRFLHSDFERHAAKYVRAGHVQESAEHWLQNTYPNGLPQQPTKPAFMSKKRLTKK